MATPDERQVVIIGSGPSGAAAARELIDKGIAVTMLESGTEPPDGLLLRMGGQNLYRISPPVPEDTSCVVVGDPRTRCHANFAPGGLSNQWTGGVPRFAPEDFTEGERLHERYRWPVSYQEMAPYYERVERYLDISADPQDHPQLPGGYARYPNRVPADWDAVKQTARQLGQGFAPYPLADGPPNMLVRRGTAFNSFSCVVRPLLRKPGFRLITGAHVLKLECTGPGGRVGSVIYRDRKTGATERLAASAFIVACGPLGTTKLLHNSVSDAFPEGLGNADGLLGHYLHDHPREWWPFELERPLSLLAPAAYLSRLPYDNSAPLMATSWTLGVTNLRDRIRSRFGLGGTSVGVQVIGTMIPRHECHALPSASKKDEFGMPALEVHIHYTDEEVQNVVNCRQHLMNLMDQAGHRAVLGPIVPTLYPGTIAHYGGTARMHADRRHGVVDAWNRIHDAPNVLVCDASCFTTAAEKNPTLTAMAIATRAAARLADDLRHG